MARKSDDGTSSSSNADGAPRNNPLARLRDLVGANLPSQPPVERVEVPARSLSQSKERIAGRVVVRRERSGRGGKAVTIVEGEALRGRDLQELAQAAARGLGTGARVEGDAIILQGDQPERVETWLRARGFTSIVRAN